jgi:hypothetical protein
MRFHRLSRFCPVTLSALTMLVACGGDDSTSASAPTTLDAGADVATPRDGGSNDTGSPDAPALADAGDAGTGDETSNGDDAGDAGDAQGNGDAGDGGDAGDSSGDAGSPSGTLLAPNATTLYGVTSDDVVVYANNLGHVARMTFAGAESTLFETIPRLLTIDGPAAYGFVQAGSLPGKPFQLVAWTSKNGGVLVSTNASLTSGFKPGVAPDGSWIVYQAGGATLTTPGPVVATSLDGKGTTTSLALPACAGGVAPVSAEATFASSGALVVTQSCPIDGGYATTTSLFAPTTLAFVATVEGYGEIDSSGTWLWEYLSSGAAVVRLRDGVTVATAADASNADTPPVRSSRFDAAGANAYYVTTSGALKRIALTATPTTTVLQASGFGRAPLPPLDPTGRWFLGLVAQDAGSLSPCLFAATPGAPLTLLGDEWNGVFTADGAYVVGMFGVGAGLGAIPTSAPSSPPTVLGADPAAVRPVALVGSKVMTSSQGQLTIVDASGASAPTMVAPSFQTALPSHARTSIAYLTSAAPAGLYVVGVP